LKISYLEEDNRLKRLFRGDPMQQPFLPLSLSSLLLLWDLGGVLTILDTRVDSEGSVVISDLSDEIL